MTTPTLEQEFKKRGCPDLFAGYEKQVAIGQKAWGSIRRGLLDVLSGNVYGYAPPAPECVTATTEETEPSAYAGKAVQSRIHLQFHTQKGPFSFPIWLILPKKPTPAPLFIHIAFRSDMPDRYHPAEEIVDGGYAAAVFDYQDVTMDKEDGFTSGLAGMYDRRTEESWGKLSMWAFAASRVLDYVLTRSDIDPTRIGVVGHSRLGKTALWAAAQDERFALGISNDSGCSGAAITRDKKGERIKDITNRFPYWFCDRYAKYRDAERDMPFDQHFLLACIAPRLVYVASAEQDEWADPQSEFLSCWAASRAYSFLGLQGLVCDDSAPAYENWHEGRIGYHMRPGTHYLSRTDWNRFMLYRNRHNR